MTQLIVDKIKQQDPGWVFSAADFSRLARRNTIDQTLSRLAKAGTIRKVAPGLFFSPIHHPLLGSLLPDVYVVAQTYAQKRGYKIQVSPAKAANLLGLSDQVPAKVSFLTDGPTKVLQLKNITINFKHVCARKLIGLDTKAGLVIQALYYFGSKGTDVVLLRKIQTILDAQDRKDLLQLIRQTPQWMQSILEVLISD